jgi:hypothetical protein
VLTFPEIEWIFGVGATLVVAPNEKCQQKLEPKEVKDGGGVL